MKYIVCLVAPVLMLFVSCKSEKCCVVISTGVQLSIANKDGSDLLNPASNGSINSENLDIYYLTNGNLEKQFKGNLDYPEMFKIDKFPQYDEAVMTVFLNSNTDSQGVSTTILKYNSYPSDTISAEIFKNDGNVLRGKV